MKTEILESKTAHTPKPKWLRVKLPTGKKYTELRGLVDKYNLHTICTSGSCPNMGECWGEGTATFMILGNICTRSCGFCGVQTGRPETVDWAEPEKVARSIKIMKIKHKFLQCIDLRRDSCFQMIQSNESYGGLWTGLILGLIFLLDIDIPEFLI